MLVKVKCTKKKPDFCIGMNDVSIFKQKPNISFRRMWFPHISCNIPVSVLQDKAFENQKLYQPHNNPAAELSSNLTHYQQHSLERAYKGLDFFWALTPSQNDYILFRFPQPIHISGYSSSLSNKYLQQTCRRQHYSCLFSVCAFVMNHCLF